jgi:hypothetical protein
MTEIPPLNDAARDAMRAARESAIDSGVDRAGGIQILVAAFEQPPAAALLGLFGVEPDELRTAAGFLGQAGALEADGDAEERTVDLARAEAARLGHETTGPEHLVLGIARQRGSIAAAVVESMGLTLDAAREAVRFLNGQVPDFVPPDATRGAGTAWSPLEIVDLSEVDVEAARAAVAAMSPFMTPGAPLVRVVAIGRGLERSGVAVELIALEIREGRSILHWCAQCNQDVILGAPSVRVADDLGTPYEVLPASSGGSGGEFRGQVWIAPSPPDGASHLVVEVTTLGSGVWGLPGLPDREAITGPWEFEIDLA